MAYTISGRKVNLEQFDADYSASHPLISWRSVVAGFIISLFFMVGFIGLGMAFGGIGMYDGTTAANAGVFSGIWFFASALISLFVGSYFAARISKFQSGRVGSAQGLVIAALFLGMFIYQSIGAIGGISRMTGSVLGKTVGFVGASTDTLSSSPMVRDVIEDSLGDLNLRSSPQRVVTGVASRLIKGNAEGAKTYLAAQAGISVAEADKRISAAKANVDKALISAREGAATALKTAGWSLFFLVFLGAISSVLGGSLGSLKNFKKPLVRKTVLKEQTV
jgi:hypothetical protein